MDIYLKPVKLKRAFDMFINTKMFYKIIKKKIKVLIVKKNYDIYSQIR